MYIYEGHMGSLYTSSESIEDKYLYCDQCGCWDYLLGEANDWKEAVAVIGIEKIQCFHEGGWAADYIHEFLSDEFDDVPEFCEFEKYLQDKKTETAFKLAVYGEDEDERERGNYILTDIFPFLVDEPKNASEKFAMDYYNMNTWLDEIPEGWRKAFGLEFLKELSEAIEKDGSDFSFSEIKEKYGQLRIYYSGGKKNVDEVIEKYCNLSEFYCVHCGKPATLVSTGWISPWCDECSKLINDNFVEIDKFYKENQFQ